ncbi:MAG: arylsulfatase A-like enzyme, partial [Lysobacterales bacterium]
MLHQNHRAGVLCSEWSHHLPPLIPGKYFLPRLRSCTAGRSAFITGQSGYRTGNLKVGLPGAKEGLQARDVTLAELLKGQGYLTAQFGKNHLGDADETLPTAHGFDEFFGSLYHLNAEQEPENPDYFKDPALQKKYGTRGVIHT